MLLYLALSVCHHGNLWANDQIEVPKEDAEYKYYLGIAEGTSTYKDAINQAFEQAVSEAIRENYGFKASISADTYLTESSSQILKRFRQDSQNINLTGFERIDMKVKTNNDKYTVQLLYRYSKRAISLELEKINSGILNEPITRIDTGSDIKNDLGGIEIITEPSNASIYLDDQPYLKSPLKVSHQITPGKHVLIIDHPAYETIKEEILILPNEITKISKTLAPAYGTLNIDSSPDGAEVFLNDKFIGTTPYKNLTLPALAKFKLKLEHPKALPQTFEEISVDKNVTRTDSFSLRLKPGRLELFIDPKPDNIYLDGQSISLDQRIFEKPTGSYQLKITKEGYDEYNEFTNIEPDAVSTKKINLVKTPEIIAPKFKFSEFSNRLYFQTKVLFDANSSFIAGTKNGASIIQSELSLGHADYVGFFAFTGAAVTAESDKTQYNIGDIAELHQYGLGIWLLNYSGEDIRSGILQMGLFSDHVKASQFVSAGTYSSDLARSAPLEYTATGIVFNYSGIYQHSVTFDLRIGGEVFKPVVKSNQDMQSTFFFGIGVGLDIIDLFR